LELRQRAIIVKHLIGQADLFFCRRLGSQALFGLCLGQSISFAEPLDLALSRRNDDDQAIEKGDQASLDNEGSLINRIGMAFGGPFRQLAIGFGSDGGVSQGFQGGAGLGIGEDDFSQNLPIQCPLRRQDLFSEAFDNLGQRWSAWFDDTPSQLVSVDHRCSKGS
jgi:hypothetical protein